MPSGVPTRRTVLAVRCLLALGALVSSLLDRSLAGVLVYGYLIWRWKEEWNQPDEWPTEVERAKNYATEWKKWRGVMAFNAAIAVLCFLIVLARGTEFGVAVNNLLSLFLVAYWIFDRARLLVWFVCFLSFVALVVTVFGPFEINLR